MHTTKIATCCYCGSRTVLQLTARDGHELACASCGAPVHEMKPLKAGKSDKKRKKHGYGEDRFDPSRNKRSGKRVDRKKKKKSKLWDAFDDVADIFDDIFD